MSSRFFTNHGLQTLFSKFQGVFASNKDLAAFDALVGYLRSSGWFAVRPLLETVPEIRILVGINVDSLIADYQKRGLLFHGAESETLSQIKASLLKDIEDAEYSPEAEKGILQFIEDVSSKRIQVRAHPTKNLHAKIYIFRPEGFNEHKPGAVITGSSNLTEAGLGVRGPESNYEFNVLLHDFDDVQFATKEFEELWRESVDVLPKDVRDVAAKTFLGTEIRRGCDCEGNRSANRQPRFPPLRANAGGNRPRPRSQHLSPFFTLAIHEHPLSSRQISSYRHSLGGTHSTAGSGERGPGPL